MDNAGELTGGLWLVATPIGSMDDFSPRACQVLRRASVILAEDTRRTGRLLSRFDIVAGGRLISFHEHNEGEKTAAVLRRLERGEAVAIVSDAGTPVLSDPGFELVREARAAGVPVFSVPGPSSFAAALAASGQPPLPATLAGFLPPRRGPRKVRLAELARVPWTIVVLLSPHRLQAELEDLAGQLGPERPATLLAELSKRHERGVMASLGELAVSSEANAPRGEYVIVIGPRNGGDANEAASGSAGRDVVEAVYREAVRRGMGRAEALRWVSEKLGMKRREVFGILSHEE